MFGFAGEGLREFREPEAESVGKVGVGVSMGFPSETNGVADDCGVEDG